MTRSFRVLFAAGFAIATVLATRPSHAVYPAVSVEEIAQTSQLIFTGTVASLDYKTSGSGVYTEATFEPVEIVTGSETNRAPVKLRYAGGQMEDGSFIEVSDRPSFAVGRKYLVFALADGRDYLTPVVGGRQGLFEITRDPASGKEVILNAEGRPVTGFNNDGMPALADVAPTPGTRGSAKTDRFEAAMATTVDGRVATPASRAARSASSAFTVAEFRNLIDRARKAPPVTRSLNLSDNHDGQFLRLVDGKLQSRDLQSTGVPAIDSNASATGDEASLRAQSLAACGTHNLPIVMEQVPQSFWEYGVIESCLAIYNNFMGVFQQKPSDGSFGNNSSNEYGGGINDGTLSGIYGSYSWGGALGVCFTYRNSTDKCARITQSDVFWNPAYSYSADPSIWFKNPGDVYNLQAVLMHETGHVWGYQTGDPEKYDYDVPTVMHAIYKNVYETGHGLHATDAHIFRQHYQSKTSVKPVSDIGVESYYASGGLGNSSFNTTNLSWGDSLDIYGVTVENMGNAAVNDLRVRFFLSDRMDLAAGANYVQIGSDWVFNSLGAERFTENDYTGNTIPGNIPTGSYYVFAYVDFADGSTDSYFDNNFALMVNKVTVTAPVMVVSPGALSRSIIAGQSAASSSFTIKNTASGILNYGLAVTYSSGATGWLSLSAYSGISTGETDTISVFYNTAGLTPGIYTARITVSAPELPSQTVNVTLTVQPDPSAPAAASDWWLRLE